MKAMLLKKLVNLRENQNPLTLAERPVPRAGRGEILIKVSACGVCHTELDEIEGRTPPPPLPVIPGHQVVGLQAGLSHGILLSLRRDVDRPTADAGRIPCQR